MVSFFSIPALSVVKVITRLSIKNDKNFWRRGHCQRSQGNVPVLSMDEIEKLLANTRKRRLRREVEAILCFFEQRIDQVQDKAAAMTKRRVQAQLKKMR